MTAAFRRFEILLPLRYNDGRVIPYELVGETLIELRQRFGAVSLESQTIRGLWQNRGREYRDELTRVFVDVPDTPDNVEYFRELKERLKARFQQLDIWMTTYPIQVL